MCSEFIAFGISRCFVRKPQIVFCERPSGLYFEVCPCSDVFTFCVRIAAGYTTEVFFSTRSSERFGNIQLASDLPTRAKQRIFPQSKKLKSVSSAP